MPVSFKGQGFVGSWSPEAVTAKYSKRLAIGVGKAAAHYETQLKRTLSRPGPTKTHVEGTSAGGEEIRASREGEPPRKRLGILRNSIRSEAVNALKTLWRVGSHLRYAFYLEFGTKRGLKPRPFFRPTLKEEGETMRRIVVDALKGK